MSAVATEASGVGDDLRAKGARPHSSGFLNKGFTIVELVVVIVVAGVLAAVAVPRFMGGNGFEERGFRDETAAALRYAQKSAVASRRWVCVNFNPGGNGLTATIGATFSATANCAAGVALQGPSGGNLAVNATGGSVLSPVPATLAFSPLGSSGAATITISVSGLPAAQAIIVEAETGYVH